MDSNDFIISNEAVSAGIKADLARTENFARLKYLRLFCAALGIALVVRTIASVIFENGENTLNGEICLPLAAGAAVLIAGVFVATRFQAFAFWLALALAGQAASLQLIDAGRLIHFQHYKSFSEIYAGEMFALIVLILQIICAGFGAGGKLAGIKKWSRGKISVLRIAPVAAFLIFAGAAVTPNFSVYATSLFFAAVVQAANLITVALAVWSCPAEKILQAREKFGAVFGETKTIFGFDRFAFCAALWTVLISALLAFFVYQKHPHVPDEAQYVFQARYFAEGKLTVDAPLVPEAFALYMVPWQETNWFSIFPPGWSALLAAGEKFGAAWLVNPLLAGLCVLLTFSFLRQIYGAAFARWSVFLLAASPWFIFTSMSLMSHTATLAAALGAALLLMRGASKTDAQKSAAPSVFAAGILIGVLSLIRPLDALAAALLLGTFSLIKFPTLRLKIFNSVVLGIGTILSAALILPYNRAVTGEFFLSPMDAYYKKYFWAGANSLGFGSHIGMHWELDAFPGHSPLEAVVNAALNFFQINTELFGWACGSLILVAAYFVTAMPSRKDLWAVASIALVLVCYSLFWYHGGPDFGARYWFLMLVPLVALTLRGAQRLSEKIDGGIIDSVIDPRFALALSMLGALSFFNYLPWRALDKYFHYLEMQPGVARLARENDFGKSLVIVRGAEFPDCASAWIYNPVDFKGDAPLYACDKSPEIRARLLDAFADRPIWFVDGPTLTGGDYKIAARPPDEKLRSQRK